MKITPRRAAAVVAALAVVAVPLVMAGTASADEGDTQSPLQGLDAVGATVQNATSSFLDAANGADRPAGADGTDTQFPPVSPNLVDGPAVGLIQNGPFK